MISSSSKNQVGKFRYNISAYDDLNILSLQVNDLIIILAFDKETLVIANKMYHEIISELNKQR